MTIFKSPFPNVAITDQSITERVFANLTTRPEAVVLIDGVTNQSLTASAFRNRVKDLAGGLTAAGFGAGKTVALMAPNSPDYCVVFHAVAWAGGKITTLNPAYTGPEVAHQLADAKADLLITVPEVLDAAKAGAGDRPIVVIGIPDFEALFLSLIHI